MQFSSPFLLASAALLLCLSARINGEGVGALSSVFTKHDIARLRELLLSTEPYGELATPYNVLRGLKALGGTGPKEDMFRKNACSYAASHLSTNDLRDLFYIASIATELGSECRDVVLKNKQHVQSVVSGALGVEPVTMETLYFATSINTQLGLSVDSEKILASIISVLNEDETIQNSALAFLTASHLSGIDLSSITDLIEDVVAQADETSTTLYYDSVQTTSMVVSGIFAVATTVGTSPAITAEQATKFGNYLVANAYTVDVVSLGHILTAANALDKNQFVVPCSLLLASSGYVSKNSPNIQVRLATILGTPPDDFSLTLLKIIDQDGGESSLNTIIDSKNGVYSYNVFSKVSSHGVYTLTFSSTAIRKSPVVQLVSAEVQVTVSFEVTVGSAELALTDREHGTTSKKISLEYPNTSKDTPEADQHSKVVMTFTLLNKETKKSVIAHQTFVRLSRGGQEIFFVATADKKTQQYTFELDMTDAASDFASLSGTYSMSLIVGDFALENPFSWDVGSIKLQFPGATVESSGEDYTYKPKPVIEHMFRPAEKLPPKIISSTFTILVLSPLALLLIMWLLIGINVSGLGTGGIWAVIFHVGLAGIFVLYFLFWFRLNMFDTLKYLVVISVPTFLAGNRMLKRIASGNSSGSGSSTKETRGA